MVNCEQKKRRMDIAQAVVTTFNNDPYFIKKVVTGDESCVYDYDIESKVQSSRFC